MKAIGVTVVLTIVAGAATFLGFRQFSPHSARSHESPGKGSITMSANASDIAGLPSAVTRALRGEGEASKGNASSISQLVAKARSAANGMAADQPAESDRGLQDSLANLTAQLKSDPTLAPHVIELLKAETDPAVMQMLAQALGEAAAALGDKFPYDSLLAIAKDDSSLERRSAAILALSAMTEVPAHLRDAMAEVARDGVTGNLRASAITCMATWMSRNRNITQDICESLLPARTSTDDPIVRGLVIQSIGNMDTPLRATVLEAMSNAVLEEPDANNRSLAALALGSGTGQDNRETILSTLENAYLSEPQLMTQRHIITQIVKAGQENAEVWLRRLPTPDPLLEQDVKDYMEILASADRSNWGAIWEAKSNRDQQRGTYPNSSGGDGAD